MVYCGNVCMAICVCRSSWIFSSIPHVVFDSLEPDTWINLDKSMYCVRVLIGIIHIIFGTLHICYLTWNITTIQWSWLTCIILVGCIYNILERINNGWREVHRLWHSYRMQQKNTYMH